MAYIEWTSDLNTGINVIDQQHRRIVQYINQLHEAMAAGNKDSIRDVLDKTVDYTFTHFAFEESLLEDADYIFSANHKKGHDLFSDKIQAFVTRFEAGEEIGQELLDTLRDWLLRHIKVEDAGYVEDVREVFLSGEGENLSNRVKRYFG